MKITELIQACHLVATRDLAKLYECANGTKTINLAVKRHINRFPERFMFRLSEEEIRNISRFQVETLNKNTITLNTYLYLLNKENLCIKIKQLYKVKRLYL